MFNAYQMFDAYQMHTHGDSTYHTLIERNIKAMDKGSAKQRVCYEYWIALTEIAVFPSTEQKPERFSTPFHL